MGELDCTTLGNLIHIQPQVSDTLHFVGLYEDFKSTITDLVHSQVKNLQVRQNVVISNILSSFRVNIVAAEVNFPDMFQALCAKNVCDTLITQVVSRQLQVLDIRDKVGSGDLVKVSIVHNWYVLGLESFDVLLEYELADLVDNPVFLLVIKQEIQIDCQGVDVLVMVKDLLEELIFVLAEELQ